MDDIEIERKLAGVMDVVLDMQGVLSQIKRLADKSEAKADEKITAKQIAIRIGEDLVFSYPLLDDGYDQIESATMISPNGVRIVERSSELKSKRTHILRNVDIISWV